MTHIFYLHSNICSIVAYDVIQQIEVSDRIVVIANRGCVFDVLQDRIEYYDATEKFKGYCNHLGSLLRLETYSSLIDYKRYLTDVRDWIVEIINKEDFILYTPNYSLEMCRMLARNSYCKQYFFIEEGTMAYMSIASIKNLNYDYKTRIGNALRFLFLGIRTCFQLELTPKFAGTIALSDKAFLWNKNKERRIVSCDKYLQIISKGLKYYDNCIIISYASYDIDMTLSAIDLAVNRIIDADSNQSIAIKLHPQSYFFYPDYALSLENRIEQKYDGRVKVLPVNYPVEAAIVLNRSSIYSIFVKSSLSLYSLVLGQKATCLITPDLSIDLIPDLKTYIAGTK